MRARNLKPGFFTNEDLADCQPLARILFEGLWCYADREGRFEWRSKRIKVSVLPYDKCDIEMLLEELRSRGFILKYTVDSPKSNGESTQVLRSTYGWIPSFHKHAAPHHTERVSDLPPPPQDIYKQNQLLPESTVNSRNHLRENPPDSLIHRFSDSLNPDSKESQQKSPQASPDPPKKKPQGNSPLKTLHDLAQPLHSKRFNVHEWIEASVNKGNRIEDIQEIVEYMIENRETLEADPKHDPWAYARSSLASRAQRNKKRRETKREEDWEKTKHEEEKSVKGLVDRVTGSEEFPL